MRERTAQRIAELKEMKAAELPERLQRLNREMAIERKLDYTILNAVRGDHRIKCQVFRCGGRGFVATASIGGRVHRFNGTLPSDAFLALTVSLKWVTRQMDFEKAAAEAAIRYEA